MAHHDAPIMLADDAIRLDHLDSLAASILADDYGWREFTQLIFVLRRISETMDVPQVFDAATHILATILNTVETNEKARSNPLARAINLSKSPAMVERDFRIVFAFQSLLKLGYEWEEAEICIADRVHLSPERVQAIYRDSPKPTQP